MTALASEQAITTSGGWEHTASSAYEDSYTSSLRYEYHLYKNFWIGPEYTYHGPMLHHNGNDDAQFDYGDLSGHSLLGDLIWYPNITIIGTSPYLIGGAGWSWWNFDESKSVQGLGISVDMGDAFAYKVGIGLKKHVSDNLSFILEWSFFKTNVPKDAFYSDGTPSIILGDDAASGRIKLGEEETRLVGGVRLEF